MSIGKTSEECIKKKIHAVTASSKMKSSQQTPKLYLQSPLKQISTTYLSYTLS